MTTKLTIPAVLMFAVVLGVGAIAPALADKASAPGHNKVTICHFDEEGNQYVQITIPPNAAEKHMAEHQDVEPVDGMCPVIDNSSPVITLNGADPMFIELNIDTYVEQNATAIDDTDGDISSSIVIGGDIVDESSLGTYLITYDVSDSAGNSATQVTRTVNVVDTTAPTITLTGSAVIDLTVGDVYAEPGATVTDNDPTTPVNAVVGGDAVDTNIPGTYIVTYDAADFSGNVATQVTRTVNVN